MNNIDRNSAPSNDRMRSAALTTTAARNLLERVGPPVVTLMLTLDPTQQSGEHSRLTLKNLVADARRQLGTWPRIDADSLLAGAQALVAEDQWWRGPGRGHVMLLAPDGVFEQFRVAEPLAPRATVDAQFAIRALLPMLHGNERFFLLAISQNQALLYAGDRFGLTPSATTLSPSSLADAMRNFEHSNDLNRHGGGQPGPSGRPFEGVHGQGSERDSRKSELQEYFRGVDEAVCGVIGDAADKPLVLAMDAPQLSIYRGVSKYPNLEDDIVAGNPDHLLSDELHRRAWAIMSSRSERDREAAVARYHDSIGTARCTTFISDIVSASGTGRVATIFVGNDRPVWGSIDAETGVVTINDERRPGDEDLVNRSVAQTLLHGGSAYGEVDLGVHTMAALYRY